MNDTLTAGTLLISDPFLKDPNFLRTAILLCEHQQEGSFGFVLNKKHGQAIGELISDLEGNDFPVYTGGPVQTDTLHFLHSRPDLIKEGKEIKKNIFWGGNFAQVVQLMQQQQLSQKDIRFFIGYSGWGEGQLANEIKEKSWITTDSNPGLVFNRKADQIWKEALKNLGGEYELMVNYPTDPQLN